MICPKCKNENSDSAIFCAHCGHKLKVVCPKCKMTNNLKAQRCTHCGLRLIRLCPVCQTPNSPMSEKCKKCATPLLRKCKSCGALSSLKATHCKKCASPLQDKPTEYTPHSTILIELTNGDIINETIAKKELAEKLIKKFFQTILTSFKPHELKALKIAPYAIGAELADIDDEKMSIIAEELLTEFQNLNIKLASVNITYDVKILVSQALSRKHKFGTDMLPKTQVGILCLDAASAIALKDNYNLEKIAPGLYAASKLMKQKIVEEILPPPVQAQPQVEAPQPAPPQPIVEVPVQTVPEPQQAIEEPTLANIEEVALQIPEPVIETVAPTPAPQPAPTPEPIADAMPEHTGAKTNAPNIQEQQQAPEPTPPPAQTSGTKTPYERNIIAEKIKEILETKKGGFIALLGDPGIGKKTIFNFAMSQIPNHNFCLLQADCHTSINTTPFATLQNLVRSMFSLPIINFGAEKMQATVKNALINSLFINDENVINPILNLIVPKASDKNIQESKTELTFAIKELFKAIKKFQKVILIIKEIEFMDKASAEIFNDLVESNFLEDAFFITTTSENSHISATMQSPKLAENNRGSFRILPFHPDETAEEFGFYIKNPEAMPPQIMEQIKIKTQGSPLFLEEIVVFLSQAGLVSATEGGVLVKPEIKDLVLPDTIEELIAVRLDSLFSQNEVIHQMIANAVCLGYSFYPLVVQRVLGLDDNTFNMLLNILATTGFLITHDNVNFKFKNKHIYDVIKNFVIKDEEQERQINANLLTIMLDMNESNSSQTAEIAKKAQNYQQAFILWSLAVKEALSTGDKDLFLKAQKESLATIDFSDYPDKEARKMQMFEHLGVANYLTAPEDSLGFLTQAIQNYEEQKNGTKVIELSAYVVKILDIMGNPQEALEYIDKTMEYINPEKMPLEIALLKFLKLKFLVESGYLGEVITLIQSDIMPNLQAGIKAQQNFTNKEQTAIKEAIVKSQIWLLRALSLQGNKNYYSVLELFVTNNQDDKAQIEVFIIDALHKTINGTPEEALTSVRKTENILRGKDLPEKESFLLDLDVIKILNKVLYEESYNVAQDVARIAQKSREVNSAFAYNVIQILFVKQLLNNKDYSQAANMTDECLNYFASQKIALFAIPGWAILSKIQAELGEPAQAISIAQQALDVASKPQIQNNYYITFMKKLLAEYFSMQGDFEMAKMHLEQAIEFAKANDLLFTQGRLYIDLAKNYLQNPNEPNETAAKLLDAAQEIATSMESKYLQDKIEKAKATLGA